MNSLSENTWLGISRKRREDVVNNEINQTLVLASTSPYRKELLQRLNIPFETISPDIDESAHKNESAETLVKRLSEEKAKQGALSYTNAFIIGSDQVAVCGDEVLGKPGNHENAIRQLTMLSGQKVSFYTGLCLYSTKTKESRIDLVPYYVQFRSLTAGDIHRYLNAEQPYNCAGSFKSEGLGISLFEAMRGDDPNSLIGLPLIRLVSWLKDAGFSIP